MRLVSLRPSPAMVVALLALTVAAAGGAVAAVEDDATYQGCVDDVSGQVRLLNARNPACAAPDTPISWNQQGPKGDPGAPGGPSDAAQAVDRFEAGKPPLAFVAKPKKIAPKLAHRLKQAGAEASDAYSTFRDGPFPVNDLFEGLPIPGMDFEPPTVLARLALPAGKWVIFAKAHGGATVFNNPTFADVAGMLTCSLVAGADFDRSAANGSTLFSTVVHRFVQPGAVELRCNGLLTEASWVKITAIRVGSLSNKPFP